MDKQVGICKEVNQTDKTVYSDTCFSVALWQILFILFKIHLTNFKYLAFYVNIER